MQTPDIELEEPMESVHLRLPKKIRAKARELARANQTSEAKVLRSIIKKFFAQMDTDCTQFREQPVLTREQSQPVVEEMS